MGKAEQCSHVSAGLACSGASPNEGQKVTPAKIWSKLTCIYLLNLFHPIAKI